MSNETKGRRKARHRGAQARANNDLGAHIESLGLATVSEYQAWRRRHGLTGAVNQDRSQRLQERRLAKRDAARSEEDAGIDRHIADLGFADREAYQKWRRDRGLSDSLRIGPEQRRKEAELLGMERAEAALRGARRIGRRPEETIRRIHSGEIDSDDLRDGDLAHVASRFAGIVGPARDAALRLLIRAAKGTDLVSKDPAVERFGPAPGNCFIDGLFALAERVDDWIRTPETWKPASRSRRRQFGSLARYLLARYEIPDFMDTVWFRADDHERRRQDWFKAIGLGENIRKQATPVPMTRMMAHLFPQAPDDVTADEAFRWSQVVGMGGGEQLARAVLGSRLGESFEEEEFWATVIHFFVRNPMLDPAQVGPIVDYIQHVKYAPGEVVTPDGVVEPGPPLFPDFSMKGRTVEALLERVDAWHLTLAKETKDAGLAWESSGLNEFLIDETWEGVSLAWSVNELMSSKELADEGRAQSHCVRSYAQSCRRGQKSVWSLGVVVGDETNRRRILTIALKNDTRTISEVRGKRNSRPSGKSPDGGVMRMTREHQRLMKEGWRILRLWADREGIKISSRI